MNVRISVYLKYIYICNESSMQTARIMVCIQQCSVFLLRIFISSQINEEEEVV